MKRIKPGKGPERWEFVREARLVDGFWGENAGIIFVLAVAILLCVLVLFTIFLPTAPLPPEEQKRELEPLVPPLLFGLPAIPPSLPSWGRQNRESAIPIHWSGHHGHRGGGHHGRHDHYNNGGHYYTPYYSYPNYSYPMWPYYSFPYNPYGYGGREQSEPRCFELRQSDGAYLKWCL